MEKDTPEKRYKEIAAWLSLNPFLTIQKDLRALRREVKCRAESKIEANERLHDLLRITNNTVTSWNEENVRVWFNTHVLSYLDSTLILTVFSDSDPGYQELKKRKAVDDKQFGLLAELKRLITRPVSSIFSKHPPKNLKTLLACS